MKIVITSMTLTLTVAIVAALMARQAAKEARSAQSIASLLNTAHAVALRGREQMDGALFQKYDTLLGIEGKPRPWSTEEAPLIQAIERLSGNIANSGDRVHCPDQDAISLLGGPCPDGAAPFRIPAVGALSCHGGEVRHAVDVALVKAAVSYCANEQADAANWAAMARRHAVGLIRSNTVRELTLGARRYAASCIVLHWAASRGTLVPFDECLAVSVSEKIRRQLIVAMAGPERVQILHSISAIDLCTESRTVAYSRLLDADRAIMQTCDAMVSAQGDIVKFAQTVRDGTIESSNPDVRAYFKKADIVYMWIPMVLRVAECAECLSEGLQARRELIIEYDTHRNSPESLTMSRCTNLLATLDAAHDFMRNGVLGTFSVRTVEK